MRELTEAELVARGERVRSLKEQTGWKDLEELLLSESDRLASELMKHKLPNPKTVGDLNWIYNNEREHNFVLGVIYQICRILRSFRKVSTSEQIRDFIRGQNSVAYYFTKELDEWIRIGKDIEERNLLQKKEVEQNTEEV